MAQIRDEIKTYVDNLFDRHEKEIQQKDKIIFELNAEKRKLMEQKMYLETKLKEKEDNIVALTFEHEISKDEVNKSKSKIYDLQQSLSTKEYLQRDNETLKTQLHTNQNIINQIRNLTTIDNQHLQLHAPSMNTPLMSQQPSLNNMNFDTEFEVANLFDSAIYSPPGQHFLDIIPSAIEDNTSIATFNDQNVTMRKKRNASEEVVQEANLSERRTIRSISNIFSYVMKKIQGGLLEDHTLIGNSSISTNFVHACDTILAQKFKINKNKFNNLNETDHRINYNYNVNAVHLKELKDYWLENFVITQ